MAYLPCFFLNLPFLYIHPIEGIAYFCQPYNQTHKNAKTTHISHE